MTELECNEFIDYYKTNINKVINIDDEIYKFDGVNLMDDLNRFSFIKRIGLRRDIIDRIRVQRVGPDIDTLHSRHRDWVPNAFVVFLNEDFEGGELTYENITITPKKLQLINATGDEWHYVKKVTSGDRFTLVCFLKEPHNFTIKKVT
jgi:hypothetical protein